jgi:hypothetical protein
MPATDDRPGFAGTERVVPPHMPPPQPPAEHLAPHAARRAPWSTDQDDDSPWPHPCHCEHVAGWLAGINDKLAFVADRDEREARERRDRQDKAEAERAEAVHAGGKPSKGPDGTH